MTYKEKNFVGLADLIKSAKVNDYLKKTYESKRYELQVHTHGLVYDKIITLFENEDPENTKFVLNSYEPITKGSVWRGIDNIYKIFLNAGIKANGDTRSYEALKEIDFFNKYITNFIYQTTAVDPNSISVWVRNGEKLENKFINTEDILHISDNDILFRDKSQSQFTIEDDMRRVKTIQYKRGSRYKYTLEKLIYVSKEEYIEIDRTNLKETVTYSELIDIIPYTFTGVDKENKWVYNSPLHSFIPFANRAIMQHRQFFITEVLYGTPRMIEREMACDVCNSTGIVACDTCDSGEDTCHSCKGSGKKTQQSHFNSYIVKENPDNPEINTNDPIKFVTLDVSQKESLERGWKGSLELAEDAIYIQKKVNTGNVESAESKAITLEAMYNWLNRIGSDIYQSMELTANQYLKRIGLPEIEIQTPSSYSILSENEAFDMLNKIIESPAPSYLKSTQIESFVSKYIPKTSNIHKILSVLQKVDKFVYFSNDEMNNLTNKAIITDEQYKRHVMAYPTLMQLLAEDSEMIWQDDTTIIKLIESKIEEL